MTREHKRVPKVVPQAPDSTPVFQVGDVIGDAYEVRSLLGSGGMAEVYEADDRALGRRVAVKVMRTSIDSQYLEREGRALAAVHHPGVVTVHTMGDHRGTPFLVLERVRGVALDRMIEDRRQQGEWFAVAEALDLLVAIVGALSAVHVAGLAHRDVKPANVMLTPSGRVVLMDFGLVLPSADRAGHRSVAGSLRYMAPEALTAGVAEGAAHLLDVYAFGVLAFELLCGIAPFADGDPQEMYRAKVKLPLPRVRTHRPDIAPKLDDFIAQLMAPKPHDRPQGAEAVEWQLRALRTTVGSDTRERAFTVLIVDDDPDMRRGLALYVRAGAPDAQIETTGDGTRAVQLVRRHAPDLLFLDLDLPGINGIEVLMLLRGMRLVETCRMVSVSGRASAADIELLRQLGVGSLTKGPNLMKEVAELVTNVRALR
jgi:serine/threonine-protein kinase